MKVFIVYLFLGALSVLVLSEKEKNHANHMQERHYKPQHYKHFESRHRQRAQEFLDRTKTQGHHGHHLQGFRYRAGNQEERCQWVCLPNSTNTSTTGFQLFYNGTSSLIATLSRQANVAIIIDYSLNLIGFLNGASGEAIIINLTTRTTYNIKYSSENGNFLWLASKRSFEAYFQNLSSLQRLYQIAESRGQKITSLNEIRYILAQFGVSPTEAFSYLISFALHLHGHTLQLFHGNGSISIPQNLQWFLSVSNAFESLLNAQGNLTNLNYLDLSKIFRSGSGIEALYNFLYQIGEHSNLSELFEEYLRNPHKILEIFEQLSGESHYGFDGLLNIVVNIIRALQGHGSFSKIFSSILNYNATSNEENTSFRTIVERFLKLAESQLQRYSNNSGLQDFIKILESLNNNNFTFNNVNISEIIKLLRSYNPAEAFSTISKIISRFSPSQAIPQFFRFIVNILNNTNSVEDIRKLLPHSIDLRNITSGAGSILHQITHGQNLTGLLSGSSCPNFSILSRIPVIGHIVEEFTKSFQNASAPFDIDQLFNASYIQDIFTGEGGIREGVTNATKFISNSQHGFENIFHKIVSGIGNTAHRFEDNISFLGGSSSDRIGNNGSVINSTESSSSGSDSSYNTSSENYVSESGHPKSSTSKNFEFGSIDFINSILGNGDFASDGTNSSGSKNFTSETATYGNNNSEGEYREARGNPRRIKHFQEKRIA